MHGSEGDFERGSAQQLHWATSHAASAAAAAAAGDGDDVKTVFKWDFKKKMGA